MAENVSRRRIPRRAILAGAALTVAGTASAYALRRGGDGNGGAGLPIGVDPTATASATRTPATTSPLPSVTVPPQPAGEVRLVSPRLLTFDTFDVVRTGEVAVLEVLGRTHSRLVNWSNGAANLEIEPGLAGEWETPDELTWLFRLRDSAAWSGAEGLQPRPVTSGDVVSHFERLLSLAQEGSLQQVQRPWDWATVEAVDSPEEGIVRFRTSVPEALLPGILAGAFAFVQRPEAVELLEADGNELVPGHVSGTGSFVFEGWDASRRLQFAAAPDRAGAGVARVTVSDPIADIPAFAAFEVDEFIARDRRDAAEVRTSVPGAVERPMWETTPTVSTMAVGAEPWNDPRLRLALSSALSRSELLERLYGGRARPSGPVSPAHKAFTLDESKLTGFPGYRDFDLDAREARAAWLAAGGDTLGEVTIDFPAPFDPRYSASSVVTGMLSEALGGVFIPRVDSYVNISRKTLEGHYGNGNPAIWFGWGPALTSPDPSLYLYETYHSSSATALSLGYIDGTVDALLGRVRGARDLEERAELIADLQRLLLQDAAGGVLLWALQQSEHFAHAYLAGRTLSPFPGQVDGPKLSVDTQNPGYRDRS